MLARQKVFWIRGVLAGLLVLFGLAAADAQGYRIRPGDTLTIEVLEDPSLNRSVLVLPDGSISFPFIGSVRAGGMAVSDLRGIIAAGLSSNFAAEPTVIVSVSSVAELPPPALAADQPPPEEPTIEVYIMGEVTNPGKAVVPPGTTILQFVAQSGGLTPFAATRRIELHRTNPATGGTHKYLFSYRGKGKGHRIAPGTVLAPGDVVIVPARRLFE